MQVQLEPTVFGGWLNNLNSSNH